MIFLNKKKETLVGGFHDSQRYSDVSPIVLQDEKKAGPVILHERLLGDKVAILEIEYVGKQKLEEERKTPRNGSDDQRKERWYMSTSRRILCRLTRTQAGELFLSVLLYWN